jgi:hypothetical protein
MEAVRSSETLVSTYRTTQCPNPEGQNRKWVAISFSRISLLHTITTLSSTLVQNMNTFIFSDGGCSITGWIIACQYFHLAGVGVTGTILWDFNLHLELICVPCLRPPLDKNDQAIELHGNSELQQKTSQRKSRAMVLLLSPIPIKPP